MWRLIGWIRIVLWAVLLSAPAFAQSRTSSPPPAPQRATGQAPRAPRASVSPRPTLVFQVGHSGRIISVAFSPEGKLLATASLDGTTRVWDAHSGEPIATLQGHTLYLRALAFSPDGKTLATGSDDKTVRLWDARNGHLKATFGHPGVVWALVFSPDGRMLATGTTDPKVRLWDTTSGQLKASLQGHTKDVTSLAFSPDGRTLASGSADGTARLWDMRNVSMKAVLHGHQGNVSTVAFSPDGKTLATGGGPQQVKNGRLMFGPGEVRLWDAASGHLHAVLRGHTDALNSLVFSPDSQLLATGSADRTARLWDAGAGQLQVILKGHHGSVQALAFSPDGRTLATGGTYAGEAWDETARLWDVKSGQQKAVLTGHTFGVHALDFSPEGGTLATGDGDGTLRMWDPRTGTLKTTRQRQSGSVLAHALSPGGKSLATGSADGAVRLWDLSTGELKATLSGHTQRVRSLAFSPDGGTLATGSDDRTARLWDARNGQLKATLPGHDDDVVSLAFSPDGKTLATGSREVRLWDAQSGQLEATLKGHTDAAWALAFSPDGRTLACGSWDKTARLWDVASGQLKAVLRGHTESVETLAFSPDGRMLATGGLDNVPRLWDARTGRLKAILKGHTEPVWSVVFSPRGETLATIGWREILLWNSQSGQRRASIRANTGAVGEPTFSRDGRLLAASAETGQVLLWDGRTGKAVRASPRMRWAGFAPTTARPISTSLAGAGVLLQDPKDGRLLATLLPLPEAAAEAGAARPIEVGARAAPAVGGEWFVTTPEGYFDCSANAARFIQWNVNGTLYPAERYLRRFRRPDLVHKALRGERITAAAMTTDDIPPAAQFVGLQDNAPAPGDPMIVTLEARGTHDVREVELLVNGRPLPPEQARPIDVGARPIDVGARQSGPGYRSVKRFTYRISLPLGSPEIHLRAVAYDASDLGSDPVEIVLKRAGAEPVVGNLYVLSVGVSRYRNADGKGFRNLQFPAADARAIAERFQREGRPLYDQVHVRTLTDEQATAANLQAGLRWLRESVRPGQVDTVVIFLSGHGISLDGRYYFATHDVDLNNIPSTSLSGQELREALGGQLRAKAVFLFADTCHAGGLGGRSDDLALEVGDGVFLLASSGAKESAYESEQWGHGAFTLALLRALDERQLAREGVLYFNALAYAVPDQVADLMKAAGRNEAEQEPCIPLAARRLRVPLVQAGR